MKTTTIMISEEEYELLKLLRKEIILKGTDALPKILQDYFKQHEYNLSYGKLVGACVLYIWHLLNSKSVVKDLKKAKWGNQKVKK